MTRIGIALAAWCRPFLDGAAKVRFPTLPVGSKLTAADKDKPVEFTVKGSNGETARMMVDEQGVSLPKDFPADVPLYAGAVVLSAADIAGGVNVNSEDGRSVLQVFRLLRNAAQGQRLEDRRNDGLQDQGSGCHEGGFAHAGHRPRPWQHVDPFGREGVELGFTCFKLA